jgi:RNA polymerase sigma factor (sigma-70 family)
MPVDLSLLRLARVQPREAPVSFAHKKWVAAGKPCLRQNCEHPHADHIPSEAMECGRCDCLRFVGLAHPDDGRCGRRHRYHRLQRSERAGSDRVNAAIVRLVIADALAQLSAEHRAVIARSYYLGWTTAQIGRDLQIAESTVKSRLHFAVRALRLSLQTQPTFSW